MDDLKESNNSASTNSENNPKNDSNIHQFSKVKLDDVTEFSDKLSPSEKRKNINALIAGGLAYGLWIILGLIVHWHTSEISSINKTFWDATSDISEAEEKIDKSSAIVNDTAISLYAVLVRIAATVTGFYFTSSSSSINNSSE